MLHGEKITTTKNNNAQYEDKSFYGCKYYRVVSKVMDNYYLTFHRYIF